MRRFDEQENVALSVIDRLLYPEPQRSREDGLNRLKAYVLRDLEYLLNTRQCVTEVPEGLENVAGTVVTYGLPDITSFGAGEELQRDLLRDAIDAAIRAFEPRLTDLSVEPVTSDGNESALHFRIEASLVVRPSPEPVLFDTTLELSSGEYIVREG